MKKITMIVCMVALIGVIGCSSKKTVDEETIETGEKTLNQQIMEAGASLEGCHKNCKQAPTAEARKECRDACKYAKIMYEAAAKMNKNMPEQK